MDTICVYTVHVCVCVCLSKCLCVCSYVSMHMCVCVYCICMCVCLVHMCVFLHSGGALVLSVIGVRLLRGSYSELSRQHIIFIFTLLFFNFDYEHYSESLPLDYFVISLVFYKVGGAGGYCGPQFWMG